MTPPLFPEPKPVTEAGFRLLDRLTLEGCRRLQEREAAETREAHESDKEKSR